MTARGFGIRIGDHVATAVFGVMSAWLMFNGRDLTIDENVYTPLVSAPLAAAGIARAAGLALAGSLPPALRAT